MLKMVVSVRLLALVWIAGCGRIGFGHGNGGLGDGGFGDGKLGNDLQLTANNGDARDPHATWTGTQVGFVYRAYSGSTNYHLHHALATLAGTTSNDTAIGSQGDHMRPNVRG